MSSAPRLAPSREALAACLGSGSPQRRVALVPTMGALHEGHASLFRLARDRVGDGPDGLVVASIFVNPLQFAAGEDLDRYPRSLDEDLRLCGEYGVDVVFAPDVAEMYPAGDPQVTVDPGPLGAVLEGSTRPGHFRGVLTVVARMLGLVQPQVAVFGEKDYQQLTLIQRMVLDLDLPVEIVAGPTQRDTDGLALSSRNRYLSPEQRDSATALARALRAGQAAGEQGAPAVLAAARAELAAVGGLAVDYLELTSPELAPLPTEVAAGTPARLLVAARVGRTRLIDNAALLIGAGVAHSTAEVS